MKKLLFIFFIFILITSCGESGNRIVDTKENKVLEGRIKGLILDKYTAHPISGALISTIPLTSTTESRENGTFEFDSVVPYTYSIVITHPLYNTYKEQIKVSDGLINDIDFFMISYHDKPLPPIKPRLISPSQGFRIGTKSLLFTWTGSDSLSLSYDLYFGFSNQSFTKIASEISDTTFKFEYSFVEESPYYWYVVAKFKNSSTNSDTNTFYYLNTELLNIPNLLGLWKLDGDATDSGQYHYDGEIQNVEFVKDRKGRDKRAAQFNGNKEFNSKILLPNNFHLSSYFTIALWIKQDPSLGDNESDGKFDCVSKWGGMGLNQSSWAFGIDKYGHLFAATSTDGDSYVKTASNMTIMARKWYHIAVVYNGGTADFYVNGKFIYKAVQMYGPRYSDKFASIGGRQDQLSSFHGVIDDVYIFTRAITPEEILKLSQE